MADQKEKTIEKLQPEVLDNELSEVDLETVAGASLVNCPPTRVVHEASSERKRK